MATFLFRPFEKKLNAAGGAGEAVGFEVQLGNPAEAEPPRKFVPQIIAGMLQGNQRILLLGWFAAEHDFHLCAPPVGRQMNFADIDRQKPGIVHLEAYDLGKFLADGLGDPEGAAFIHLLGGRRPPLNTRVSASAPVGYQRAGVWFVMPIA